MFAVEGISTFLSKVLGRSYTGRMIVSSRESLFDESLFDGGRFQLLQIQPLTQAMQSDVLRRRFKNPADVAEFEAQQSVSENLKELGSSLW